MFCRFVLATRLKAHFFILSDLKGLKQSILSDEAVSGAEVPLADRPRLQPLAPQTLRRYLTRVGGD